MAQKTQIIAHRGYWKNAHTTENSVTALKNAQKLPIYGSEFDIQMTKDDVLVVNHDKKINGINIEEYTYDQLKNEKLENGEKLPTLEAYLIQGKQDKECKLIVEIKPQSTPERESIAAQKTLELIKTHQLQKQSEFISFSLHLCKEIKRFSPNAHVQYLNGDLTPEEVKQQGLDGIDYHYKLYFKNPQWIAQAKKIGLVTNAWTVNKIKDFKKLQTMGLNFVTTNHPDKFLNQNNNVLNKKR